MTFNSIFDLRDASDPSNSRAPYTYRIYQVVELLFFIALVWSIEKILIRYISLNFHAVAYADRLKNNAFALSTIDTLKSYRPKKAYRRTGGGGHSGFNTPSAFSRVGFGGTSDGYFSSPNIGRSRASTPPFGNGSPAQQQQTQVTSPIASIIPGAPEPSHQSLWSRLPIPPTFRGHNSTHHQNLPSQDNAIPLQVTSQHFSSSADNRRTAPGHPSYSTQSSQHNPLSSSQPESASASVPTTPGGTGNAAISSANTKAQGKKNKKQKALHLFGKKAVTAQEIARQAMVDPLKTLNNPNIVGKGLGLDFGGAKDAKKLARDLFYAFRSVGSVLLPPLFPSLSRIIRSVLGKQELTRFALNLHLAHRILREITLSRATSIRLSRPSQKQRQPSQSLIKMETAIFQDPKSELPSWLLIRRESSWLEVCKMYRTRYLLWIDYSRLLR